MKATPFLSREMISKFCCLFAPSWPFENICSIGSPATVTCSGQWTPDWRATRWNMSCSRMSKRGPWRCIGIGTKYRPTRSHLVHRQREDMCLRPNQRRVAAVAKASAAQPIRRRTSPRHSADAYNALWVMEKQRCCDPLASCGGMRPKGVSDGWVDPPRRKSSRT